MDAAELAAFADEALAGLGHRRIDVEPTDGAERLRAGFAALGWLSERLVWMRHEAPAPPGPQVAVETVPYDDVVALREAWFQEDFPGVDLGGHLAEAREVAMLHGARVLAVIEAGEAVAFAQLECAGRSAEIVQVYVRPDRRGRGLGTAVTRAAIEAAGEVEDLWIVADDEDRPKQLYMRLGFRPSWTAVQLLRPPQSGR